MDDGLEGEGARKRRREERSLGGPGWICLPPRRTGLALRRSRRSLGSANSAPKPPCTVGPRRLRRYRDLFGCRKRRLRLPASPSLSLADGPAGRPRERRNKEEDLFALSLGEFFCTAPFGQANKQTARGWELEGWPGETRRAPAVAGGEEGARGLLGSQAKGN